jgi:hypothetical protein
VTASLLLLGRSSPHQAWHPRGLRGRSAAESGAVQHTVQCNELKLRNAGPVVVTACAC